MGRNTRQFGLGGDIQLSPRLAGRLRRKAAGPPAASGSRTLVDEPPVPHVEAALSLKRARDMVSRYVRAAEISREARGYGAQGRQWHPTSGARRVRLGGIVIRRLGGYHERHREGGLAPVDGGGAESGGPGQAHRDHLRA